MNGSPMYTLQEELSQSHKNTSLANKQHINLQIPIKKTSDRPQKRVYYLTLASPWLSTSHHQRRSLIPIKGLAAAKRGCLIMPIYVVPNTNLVMILSKKNGIGCLVH